MIEYSYLFALPSVNKRIVDVLSLSLSPEESIYIRTRYAITSTVTMPQRRVSRKEDAVLGLPEVPLLPLLLLVLLPEEPQLLLPLPLLEAVPVLLALLANCTLAAL
jgi:hypothetical protein